MLECLKLDLPLHTNNTLVFFMSGCNAVEACRQENRNSRNHTGECLPQHGRHLAGGLLRSTGHQPALRLKWSIKVTSCGPARSVRQRNISEKSVLLQCHLRLSLQLCRSIAGVRTWGLDLCRRATTRLSHDRYTGLSRDRVDRDALQFLTCTTTQQKAQVDNVGRRYIRP